MTDGGISMKAELLAEGEDPERWAIEWAVSFIPRLASLGHKFGGWRGGAGQFPRVDYSPIVQEFVEGLYHRRLMVQFDWSRWNRGRRLAKKPAGIEQASAPDCQKLITAIVRNDRFCEGALLSALEHGLIQACLQRLAGLYAA